TVHLPGASLDWTVTPRFDAGYLLPDGFGEIVFSYRFLTSDGHGTIPNFDSLGSGLLRSRLDLNAWDIDYGSHEFTVGSRWDLKPRVGLRLANVFFDSRAEGLFISEKTSNQFRGAGPHVGLDVWRRFEGPGFALFARVESALLVGHV